jgi:2-polyprenyl-3-methyl-5-hydroxy-6-metoxy-1,4-benzoquinol methylase
VQKEQSKINQEAWNQSPYQAWTNRFGPASKAADKIKEDPAKRLKGIYKHLGDVKGKKIVNLLGSHGSKAVALALLEADVTVVDISSENARYANELAQEAGVSIRYIVSDALELPEEELSSDYDVVFMELGILHYFTDLKPIATVISKLLRVGGRLVLQDFHPISTKLITSKGTTAKIRKHKITGDYFDTSLEETEVAYAKLLPQDNQQDLKKVLIRKWTIGEIVTAIAGAGLFIRLLDEEPNLSSEVFDKGIPKTFTLVAEKIKY